MSKKLPDTVSGTVSDSQRERLARWLQEWRLDGVLADASLGDDEGTELREDRAAVERLITPVSDERRPAAGQIRLLHPEAAPTSERPVYLALLCAEGDGLLAAKYSRFSEPALTGELATGRVVPCMRVICVWNAHILSARLLEKSWFVDELDQDELRNAIDLREALVGSSSVPARLVDSVGPPLCRPDDPRYTYRRAEAALMDSICDEDERTSSLLFPELSEDSERLKAAEPHEPYGTDRPDK